MKRRIVLVVALVAFAATSLHAQATDFFALVKSGTPQEVLAAIKKGADVKARETTYGATPIILAASYNPNPEVVTVLLKAGADVNAKDSNGRTALMWAAGEDPDVIKVILKAGADVNAQSSVGVTALMYAAEDNPNPEAIQILLGAGADAKAKDILRQTALDFAQNNANHEQLKDTDALRQLEKASK